MKCPYCKKEIETKERGDRIMDYWIPNCFLLLIPNCFLLLLPLYILSRFLPFPINIEDGLSLNWDMVALFIISTFYFIYIELYLHNKVKGRLLLYTYWIEKKRN